jgi:phosphatidylglycerol:prolipoprotein diacylglycerol transferase
MTYAAIQFPPFDPVALHLGPLAIRWYGLAYLGAFLSAYILLRHLAKTGFLRSPVNRVDDLVAWAAAGVVVGGRAGWWLVYHRSDGTAEPWYEPLAMWHGGMSFHGGLLGVAVALWFWSRRSKVAFFNVADAAALVTPVGLFFGRIANFVNAELVGRPSHVPWAVVFPGDYVPRHPSQLYEALLEGPTLLLALWLVRRWAPRQRDGGLASLFLAFYGVFRFAVEFTRQPDPQLGFVAFGWLTMGQVLSAFIMAVGLAMFAWTQLSARDRCGPTLLQQASQKHG